MISVPTEKGKYMRFKDFEIRPANFLDGHTDPKLWDVVKWEKTEPREVIDGRTGQKRMSDKYCFSIAFIEWDAKEECWEFRSVGKRFLEYYEDGLCEIILKWMELTDLTRRLTSD